jgi:hypothetical protein
MRTIGRAAAILITLVVLTGCGAYEEQKQVVVQSVTAAVLSNFVDAQQSAPLTQGSFTKPGEKAPQSVPVPAPSADTKCTCVNRPQKVARS